MKSGEELWRASIYPRYMISTHGRVISLAKGFPAFKKVGPNDKGYPSISAMRKRVSTHRMIALAFLPNPNGLPCVNHKDGDKSNNHISNLEWASWKRNNDHAIDTGLRKTKLCRQPEKINEIRLLLEAGQYTHREIGKMYGVCKATVTHIKSGYLFKEIK